MSKRKMRSVRFEYESGGIGTISFNVRDIFSPRNRAVYKNSFNWYQYYRYFKYLRRTHHKNIIGMYRID